MKPGAGLRLRTEGAGLAARSRLPNAPGMRSPIYAALAVSFGLVVALVIIERAREPVLFRADPLDFPSAAPSPPAVERMPNAWWVPPTRDSTPGPTRAPNPETPTSTPFTVAPTLRNREEVAAALEREFPPALRAAGVGAVVHLWILIDDDGAVRNIRLDQSSGRSAFDDAAIRVGRAMRYSPALNRGDPVAAWVWIPIAFRSERSELR